MTDESDVAILFQKLLAALNHQFAQDAYHPTVSVTWRSTHQDWIVTLYRNNSEKKMEQLRTFSNCDTLLEGLMSAANYVVNMSPNDPIQELKNFLNTLQEETK